MASSNISHKAALKILNDFNWHHRRELVPLTHHIPPELASRAYLHAVPASRRECRIKQDPDTQVKLGRVRIADKYITLLKAKNVIEVIGTGDDKHFRLIHRAYLNHNNILVIDLKRCPCCDGKPDLIDVIDFNARIFRAECTNCGLNLENNDKQTVINAWNTRQNQIIIQDTTTTKQLQKITARCKELEQEIAQKSREIEELYTITQLNTVIIA